jgi:hypothetical protein
MPDQLSLLLRTVLYFLLPYVYYGYRDKRHGKKIRSPIVTICWLLCTGKVTTSK